MDKEIEKEVAEVSTAPRITREIMEAEIEIRYFVRGDDAVCVQDDTAVTFGAVGRLRCMTLCFVVLRSGFIVVGKSACASPENYNKEIGEKIAYEDAIRQMWEPFGFYLKQKLADGEPWPHSPAGPPTEKTVPGDQPEPESDIPF